eukprot:2196916-Prymnesium_polylepis.1
MKDVFPTGVCTEFRMEAERIKQELLEETKPPEDVLYVTLANIVKAVSSHVVNDTGITASSMAVANAAQEGNPFVLRPRARDGKGARRRHTGALQGGGTRVARAHQVVGALGARCALCRRPPRHRVVPAARVPLRIAAAPAVASALHLGDQAARLRLAPRGAHLPLPPSLRLLSPRLPRLAPRLPRLVPRVSLSPPARASHSGLDVAAARSAARPAAPNPAQRRTSEDEACHRRAVRAAAAAAATGAGDEGGGASLRRRSVSFDQAFDHAAPPKPSTARFRGVGPNR